MIPSCVDSTSRRGIHLNLASLQSEFDGPLIDYAAKGTRIELERTEKVEGDETYKLKLTMKDREPLHLWIEAQTLLETKIEESPRWLDGQEHKSRSFRDYRAVNGLQLPFVLETRLLPLTLTSVGRGASRTKQVSYPSETILIDKVLVNSNLDAALFMRPTVGPTTLKETVSH